MSLRSDAEDGYNEIALKMEELVAHQSKFLGYKSAKSKLEITVCYRRNIDVIRNWKCKEEHVVAREKGRQFGILHIKKE